MIATAPFRLEVLNSDHNAGTLTLVAPTEGLTFAFLGSGATAPAAAPARLFGLDPDAELAIEEVSLGGSVPTLRAHNRSAHDILIIAGQVVRGGKQNRGVNSDMLVAAGQFADVPVTCVEQGRWSGDPRSRFSHAGIEPIAVRTAKMRDVHMSRRMRNSHEADQGRVWNAIADMQSSFGVASRSNDLLASMEAVRSGNFGAAAPELFVDDRTLELRDRARRTAMEISRMSRMLASCLGAGDLNEAAEIQHALEIAQGRLRDLRVELDAAEAAARARAGDAGADRTPSKIDFAAADDAARNASGMLVFFEGEFVAGDIFADPRWFAKLYGDLRDSAISSWLHLSRRLARKGERRVIERIAPDVTARAVMRSLGQGEWRERPVVAQGRGWMLEDPAFEGSVLAGAGNEALHLLVSTRHEPGIVREAMDAARQGRPLRD